MGIGVSANSFWNKAQMPIVLYPTQEKRLFTPRCAKQTQGFTTLL